MNIPHLAESTFHPPNSSSWPNVSPTSLSQVSFTLLLINETEGLNKDFQEALVRSQGLSDQVSGFKNNCFAEL